jgi:DNA-binding GntR family transcriptional regulator
LTKPLNSAARSRPGEQEKLADAAYRSLLSQILSHELPGGTVIQERKLALAMGVSRTPMRDALARLEGLGLLVRLTDRLMAVRVITLQDYLHSLDVRAMIEPQAAAHATKTIGAAEVAALQGELDALARHSGDDIDALHWRFDDMLHDTIAQNSGNPILREMIDAMRRYTKIFERQTVPLRTKPGIEDHRRILDALSTGRPEKVRDAMADHIRNVRKRALDGL